MFTTEDKRDEDKEQFCLQSVVDKAPQKGNSNYTW
jgi:hypothetical protein